MNVPAPRKTTLSVTVTSRAMISMQNRYQRCRSSHQGDFLSRLTDRN